MALRSQVLSCFKKLHRTRRLIFDGDENALAFAKNEINSEFKKNKTATDEAAINEMLQHGINIEKELRTMIVQAKEVRPGVYRARILPDTQKLDNVEYNEIAVEEAIAKRKKKPKGGSKQCSPE